MSEQQSIKTLEHWLLVPVDYESILPALSELRGSQVYESYISRVAEAEFSTPQKIDNDVASYLANKGSFASKRVSAKKSDSFKSNSMQHEMPPVELNALNADDVCRCSGADRVEPSSVVRQCSLCRTPMNVQICTNSRFRDHGCLIVALLIFFTPVGVILLVWSLMGASETKEYVCPRCGRRDAIR